MTTDLVPRPFAGTPGRPTPTLVLGATGKTGRRVAARLTALGVPVRAGSRSATPPFDWDDRATWPAALDGVAHVYLAFAPDLAVPGAAATVEAFTAAAADAGVRRIVLLSGRGEPEAQACEGLVARSGLEWAVVRASFFSQNFDESFLLDAVRAGTVALPVDPAVPEPFVDVEDIADVAVAALTGTAELGRVHEVTGPRALTFGEALADVSAAAGREVSLVPVPVTDWSAAALADGLDADLVALLAYLFAEVLDGRNARPTDGVERALGRPARTWEDYVARTAATGVWGA